jgi:hypothetical protein
MSKKTIAVYFSTKSDYHDPEFQRIFDATSYRLVIHPMPLRQEADPSAALRIPPPVVVLEGRGQSALGEPMWLRSHEMPPNMLAVLVTKLVLGEARRIDAISNADCFDLGEIDLNDL